MAEGLRLTLDITDGGLGPAVKRAVRVASDLRPLFTSSAGLIEASIDRRFDTGRGPGGVPWPPSKRSTSAARPGGINKDGKRGKSKRALAKVGPNRGGKTLVNTGKLRGSITREIGTNEMQVGVDGANQSAKYARVHQFGATIEAKPGKSLVFTGADGGLVFAKSVTIPARPFVGFDDQDVSDLDDLWTKTLKGAFDGD